MPTFTKHPFFLWGLVAILVLPALVIATLLALNSVDTEVTDADREAIEALGLSPDKCNAPESIDDELRCIRHVQQNVFELLPDTTCAFDKGNSAHGAADYVDRGYGCCYDRATLIEQTLRKHDFQVRRAAVYKRQSSPHSYLLPGIPSHALSEVKTREGWVAVDSIEPFIAADDDHRIFTLSELRDAITAQSVDDQTFGEAIPSNFFDGEFVYIYGVYSRHGYFFEPHIPVPEVAWSEFALF